MPTLTGSTASIPQALPHGLWAIAYISTSSTPLSESEIEALLMRARAFNAEVGVTGALLVHERTFFQYFEGPAPCVALVYQRIQASLLHKNIIELLNQSVDKRVFSSWLMGFAEVSRSMALQLEQAQWRTAVGSVSGGAPGSRSVGLNLLLDFCGNGRGGLSV